MSPKETGEFIAALRKEKELTQKQLAEMLNVSDKAISRWETGKGYPDIDSLMMLSRVFSLSVNELLCGNRIESEYMAQTAENDIAKAYVYSATKERKVSKIAIVLSTVLICIIAVILLDIIPSFYRYIIGSPNCIIAEDYSYITLFGQCYVPLVLDDVDCIQSELLIPEAQVEGSGFLKKLLFGEMVYTVRNCPNNDIIYLQSEYDNLVSPYYCKADKLELLQVQAQNDGYNIFTVRIPNQDDVLHDILLEQSLKDMLSNANYTKSKEVNCDHYAEGTGEMIEIHTKQNNTPFIRYEGALLKKYGEYYWFDYDDIPATQNNADYTGILAYEIDDSYDSVLETLFSYLEQ